jgi:hypothetical protein
VNFCRTKMAGKNSKKAATSSNRVPPNKLPDIKLELVTPSQLVKYDPHQITHTNSPNKPSSSRMISLGKPAQSSSFAKSLTSDYDPFNKKIVLATPAAPIKSKSAKTVSPYVPLYGVKLFYIEFIHRSLTNPLHLISAYYPLHPSDGVQQHFSPSDPGKTIHYYQNILQQEGSIIIKSIFDKFHNKKLLYHKIEIIKFTHMKQWGDPFTTKPLQGHSPEYSYYDYIDACQKSSCINLMICLILGLSSGKKNIILLKLNANHPCGFLNGGLSMAVKLRSFQIPCGTPRYQLNRMIHH